MIALLLEAKMLRVREYARPPGGQCRLRPEWVTSIC